MSASIWLHKWSSYRFGCIKFVLLVAAAIVWAACASPAPAETCASPDQTCGAASKTPIDSFQAFCDGWMEKLRDRELNNLAHIQWQTGTEGVQGTYIGYSGITVLPPSAA